MSTEFQKFLRERKKRQGHQRPEGEIRESYRTPAEAERARDRGRYGYEFVRIEPVTPSKHVVVWRRKGSSNPLREVREMVPKYGER